MRLVTIFILVFTICMPSSIAEGKGKGKGKGNAPKNKYAKGQDKHEAAVTVISTIIANETGIPAQNYTIYAGSLADTLGQLDEAALARVFGDNFNQLP